MLFQSVSETYAGVIAQSNHWSFTLQHGEELILSYFILYIITSGRGRSMTISVTLSQKNLHWRKTLRSNFGLIYVRRVIHIYYYTSTGR